MEKRKIVVFIFLTAALLISTACISISFGDNITGTRGSGNLATESRNVSGFTAVSLSGIGDLEITLGETEALEIEAEDNLIELIESEVRGGTLYLGFKSGIRNIQPTESVKFRLTMKSVDALDTSGVGSIRIGAVRTETLRLSTSGTGSIRVEGLDADRLIVDLSGTGKCTVGEGEVGRMNVDISGTGSFDAPDLMSQEADISISGAGSALLWVMEDLNLDLSGASQVQYYGQPRVSQSVSGAASVKSLGDK